MSDVSEWWSTSIIEMEPGSISLRGMPIENLIGVEGSMFLFASAIHNIAKRGAMVKIKPAFND